MKIGAIHLLNYFIGCLACAISFPGHVWTLFKPGRQNKEDMFDNAFGLADPDPRMREAWRRVEAWRWRDFFHDRKNLPVEHARLHPQRWVKASLFLWLAREALGLIL